MHTVLKAKIGPFLVIAPVLAVWTFLAAQPVQAHETTLPTPTCSSLPDDAFFTTPSVIGTGGTPTPALTTQQGVGSTTRERLRYAKITIPALAAGELRVFSTTSPSDAVLCRGGTRASSRTSYTAHNNANTAASNARTAADNAAGTNASVSTARNALQSAASALTRAANALDAAGLDGSAATAAATSARAFADNPDNTTAGAFESELDDAAAALEAARDLFHSGFQIRAEVRPGDASYVLVVAVEDVTNAPTLAVQFHGAIEAGTTGLEGLLRAGEIASRSIVITAPGLLTVETTGSTDTIGMFGTSSEMFESGGSGGNFKIVLPVKADTSAQTLTVEGQTPTTTGAYTLNMDFQVAQGGADAPSSITIAGAPTWTGTAIAADDTMLQIDGSADADYFVFDSAAIGFLTVEATNASGTTRHSDTRGELYGPMGQIATATSGNGNHFSFRVPVDDTQPYLLKVTGTTGMYDLRFAFQTATAQGTSAAAAPSSDSCPADPAADPDATAANLICPSASTGQQERDRYLIDIMEPGTLYVHATGRIRTRGVLYGPDGGQLGEDTGSASDGINFSIAARVNPGPHIVEVRGYDRLTTGAYGLVTSFVAGDGGPTTPGTGDEVAELRAEIARLENALDVCRDPVETDTRGVLENPSGTGFRSGISLISGWVCAAEEVEARIYREGVLRLTLDVAYGTSRPDTVGQCRHSSANTGFGMTYNFNHLHEGEYTIRAYADDEQIGEERTFRVVHLTEFEDDDTDRFLRDLSAAECRISDFPAVGGDTWLLWEHSIQNFVIQDAG